MRGIPAAILAAACLGLLAAQWGGIHTHVNADGFHGAAQGAHDHHHHDGDDDDDDHDGDIDVRVVDYGLSASKLLFFLVAFGPALFLLAPARGEAPSSSVVTIPLRRRTRWRPPLRAPPLSLRTV